MCFRTGQVSSWYSVLQQLYSRYSREAGTVMVTNVQLGASQMEDFFQGTEYCPTTICSARVHFFGGNSVALRSLCPSALDVEYEWR